MAVTVVGGYGDGVRGDARITIRDGAASVTVKSLVESMYGDAIRDQVASCLQRFGQPDVAVEVEDAGALPFVLEARLEAALTSHIGGTLPVLEPRPSKPIRDRLRRTRLYVPGNSPKLHPNVSLYQSDAVILDLEDSVAPSEKFAARVLVRRALHTLDFGRSERMVRINSGPMGLEDIQATAPQGVETFLIPKAESIDEVTAIETTLTDCDSPAHLILILESALGVHKAFELATASKRVIGIAIGVEDYLASIHASKTESGAEMAWAHGAVINAARAAGVAPFASVFAKLGDDAGMESYAKRMSDLGFEGVGCIHPRQVQAAHRGFTPSEATVEKARRVVDAYDAATASGVGAISVDGAMVDVPVYLRAKRTLSLAGGAE